MKTFLRFSGQSVWREEVSYLQSIFGDDLVAVTSAIELETRDLAEQIHREMANHEWVAAWELALHNGMDTDDVNDAIRKTHSPLVMSEFKRNDDGSYFIDRSVKGRPRMVFTRFVRVVRIEVVGGSPKFITSLLLKK